MIYLTEGNTPLNEAYNDEIVQERNNTYQLTFRFPTSDPKWELLKEETFLTADDLHGEQDFYIFEIEKQQGYIQVYANQVISLLNNYIVSSIDVDRVSGTRVLSALAGSITRTNPFSFFSDIDDRHTLNIKDKNAMEVLAKDKHSILGQWGGDMVRNGYNLRLLKNGGSENESLFMYKKNLSSYQHKTSTKSLKTRITFKTTVKGEGEKAPDVDYVVVIDSPLLGKYSQIYEAVVEVNDQNVKDQASLIEYGKQYFRTSMCDMLEDNLEISVVGQSDVAVRMFDVVSIYHDWYGLDVRKKITKYTYSPMAKRLKSIGFGTFQSSLANAIGGIVNDAVLNESQNLHKIFEERLKKEIVNADRAFDAEFAKHEKDITDGIELAKAKAEEVKQELSDTINQRFDSFDNGPLKEAKRKAEEALRNAGASSLLAQEAKRIGLDSTAKLEEFKRQATSAQTALSGDLDALKRTVMNDIRPKQEQVTAEIAKQVEALVQTKKELAGVKSAQATYEETTTRRFAELTNLANGKASKSELTQTAEELASKIASVQASGRNLFLNSLFKQDISKTRIWTTSTYEVTIDSESKYLGHNALKIVGQDPMGRDGNNPKITYPALGQFGKVIAGSTTNQDITITFYAKANKNGIMLKSRLGNIWYKTGNVTLSTEIKRYVVHIPKSWTNESKLTTNEWLFTFNQEGTVWIWMPKFEISDVDTSYSEAPEDIEGQISAVESNFKQRADALDAGVSRLTEGLRTKADISSLNVTAENIRQSVKSLETSTQNKLDQKLSMTEFEVRASGIHQEILNATKDKADKTLVVAEAGKLREEFSNLRVGGTNLLKGSKGPFLPDRKPANFDNAILYAGNTSIYMEQGQEYIISAKTDGTFTAHHDGNKESDNVVLWIMDKDVRNYQIVSDLKTGTTGTKFVWDKPTGIYHLRVNTYRKEATKSVWDVKIEKGNVATDWSPAPEDTEGLITEAKATFERTAQGLRTDLSAIQDYVNKDGQRQEALQRYTREESARQATAVRELVTRDYVGKATYQEDVKGINQRIEAVKTSANKEIASQIASYRQSVDGKFTDISSQITTYKQDLGGQISGLSNRLTSSEQGTTTQISNLSNRINSNKQGTDNQISNLKTQVATNKDNAERQMGRISDQVSANKANADSQFANVTNQLARKVEATDFQRVKETSQLYERILGNTENGIADKVARMAMTNQLFQVEVSKNEGLKTVQRQLADSWAVQNINSAGDIISGINLGANGHNRFDGKLTHITGETLIDKAVIKSAMIDKLKTANFEAGSVTTTILDAEAVTAEKVRFDEAFIRKMIANEAFIEQLTSKQIFATKVESVVSSSTFLEAYQGRIGGFTIGHFDQGRGRWISGINQFSVGMGNGEGGSYNGENTAFWANWGYSWNYPGPNAWYVTTSGNMYCRNGADFHGKVDFSNRSTVNFYSQPSFSNGAVINGSLRVSGRITYSGGEWLYSPIYNKLWKDTSQGGTWLYLNRQDNGKSDWIHMNKVISDRRYKSNIQDSQVSGLDVIEKLKTYSYRKEYDGKIEDISCGIMAQDVQKYAPEAFYKNPDGAYTYETFALVPYLIKAIQELNQKIEKMEKTIA
nr:MAG TPA: Neck appendage protein [Caudoviricetes sp.]